jgi:tetratricopeptide (TPR) repeat protein
VLAERKSSGRRAMAVANYLWSGLDLHPRAIEILLVAHRSGLLNEGEQAALVSWLQNDSRFAESIPLLEALIVFRPDSMHYRTQLMLAYHRSSRPEQLAQLVEQIELYFHQGGRWTESNIAQFARGCASCNLQDKAVKYFDEAIALHQRNHPGSGLNDSDLSYLYRDLARSHSALGHTIDAVKAASSAIVCWGPTHNQRHDAIEGLKQVLNSAQDLEAYVQHLDQESAQSKQDSPILRKVVGQTLQSRGKYSQAIVQLQLAAALQPNDKEIHQHLIVCYDAVQDGIAATRQLLKLIDLNRHDLALYQQLADRMKDNEAEAERAATSIIESSPNEAESHNALAELRQKQNRWDEAIPHWQQVAELRRLEPTGLLNLARAQIHEKQWDAAKKSIETLQRTEWPTRFGSVSHDANGLQQQLPK